MPQISVIVPVYKVEKYLSRCIESILSQTYLDWELLLIDDGSPDKSGEICDLYAMEDLRIKVFHKQNEGVSSARNLGIDNAIGQWVMFVDADDWLSVKCLEICMNEVYKYNLDAIQFSYKSVYPNGRIEYHNKQNTSVLPPNQYLNQNSYNVSICGGLYRRQIIVDASLKFLTELKLAEDQIFVLSFLRNASRIRFVDYPLYFYFQHPESAVHNPHTKDLVNACYALIDLSREWEVIKLHVDTTCIVLMTAMIRNQDVNYMTIKEIYHALSPKYILSSVPKSSFLFFEISLFSLGLAYYTLSIYYRLLVMR